MIRRGKHRADYTILPNLIPEHPKLSAAAKGTLFYLLSRPPGWEIRHQHLRHIMRLGRDAFKRVMAEIIAAGFAWRSDEQQRTGDNAFLGYDYIIYDQPQNVEIDRAVVGFPTTGSRCRKPDSESKEGDTKNLDINLSGDDGWDDVPPRDREIETPTDEEVIGCLEAATVGKGSKPEPSQDSAAASCSTASLGEFQAAWGTSAIDNLGRTMRAFGALTADERRAAIDGIKPFRSEMERAKRTHSIAGWRYLEEKRWSLLPPQKAAVAEGFRIKPLSRDWWALLLHKIERGDKIGFFLERTINAWQPWTVTQADMPTLAMVAALEAYPFDGDVAKAWEPWLRAHGVRLPARDSLWIFLPGPTPPTAEQSTSQRRSA